MSEHDFAGALDTWNAIQHPVAHQLECSIEELCNNIPVNEMKVAIKAALTVLDKMQRGEVSKEVSREGSKVLISRQYKKYSRSDDARECFKAMSAQMIKEACDGQD